MPFPLLLLVSQLQVFILDCIRFLCISFLLISLLLFTVPWFKKICLMLCSPDAFCHVSHHFTHWTCIFHVFYWYLQGFYNLIYVNKVFLSDLIFGCFRFLLYFKKNERKIKQTNQQTKPKLKLKNLIFTDMCCSKSKMNIMEEKLSWIFFQGAGMNVLQI